MPRRSSTPAPARRSAGSPVKAGCRFPTNVARNRLQGGAVVELLFAFVYLLFPTRNYYWDGVSFAIDIERAQSWRELFNVHHLLYNFIGYGEYQLLGSRVRALYLMQWTNCIAGALLIWLADRLFRSLGVPPWNSAAGAAILGASATFWKFTTDADSYILANVFLAAAYLALRRSAARGGLLHVCATMMHQLSALFYPVGLALLWRRSRERFWRDAAIYTLVSAGGTLAVYAAAFRLAVHRAPTFAGWLTFHAKMPFSFDAARNTGWLLLGTGKLFAGGKLSPTAYLAGPVAVALLVFAVAGLAHNRRRLLPVLSDWPLLVWVGAYLCFLLVWEPYNTSTGCSIWRRCWRAWRWRRGRPARVRSLFLRRRSRAGTSGNSFTQKRRPRATRHWLSLSNSGRSGPRAPASSLASSCPICGLSAISTRRSPGYLWSSRMPPACRITPRSLRATAANSTWTGRTCKRPASPPRDSTSSS